MFSIKSKKTLVLAFKFNNIYWETIITYFFIQLDLQLIIIIFFIYINETLNSFLKIIMNAFSTLDSFLAEVSQSQKYKILLAKASLCYQISNFNLQKLTIKQIKNIRKRLVSDLQDKLFNKKNSLHKIKNAWSNNQLKLFAWVIVCYSQLMQRHIRDLTQDDWRFLVTVVPTKSIQILKYESLKLYKENSLRQKWTEDEDDLLLSILTQQKMEGQWNEVSRLLYFKSQNKFFKNPRKCRERWFNHLSRTINRDQWTMEEDLILFQTALAKGCKWSLISKALNGTRTEHMIKNRYKCKIGKMKKMYGSMNQTQLVQKQIGLIKRQIKKVQESSISNQRMQMQIEKASQAEYSENQQQQLKDQNNKELDFNLSYITGIIDSKSQLEVDEEMIQIDSNYKQFQTDIIGKDQYLLGQLHQTRQDLFSLFA